MYIVATNPSHPSFFESPQYLRIKSPIVERFRDRKRVISAMAGLETAIHELRLPFHKRKTPFGVGTFPLVKEVCAVNLSARICAGLVGAKRARNAGQDGLRVAQIKGILEAW